MILAARPSTRGGINPLTKFDRQPSVGHMVVGKEYNSQRPQSVTGVAKRESSHQQQQQQQQLSAAAQPNKEETMIQLLENSTQQQQQRMPPLQQPIGALRSSQSFSMGRSSGGAVSLNEVRGSQFRILSLGKSDDHICERCMDLRRSLKQLKSRNEELKRSNLEVQEIGYRKNLELENTIASLNEEQQRLKDLLAGRGIDSRPRNDQEVDKLHEVICVLEAEVHASNEASAQYALELEEERERNRQLERRMEEISETGEKERKVLEDRSAMILFSKKKTQICAWQIGAVIQRAKGEWAR